MSNQNQAEPTTALLGLVGYLDLCIGESLCASAEAGLGERLLAARLSAETLQRSVRVCDAIVGGQNAARSAIESVTSPVDEFWAVTKPRVLVEQQLRLMVVASTELELVQRVAGPVSELAREAIAPTAGLWRAIDHGSSQTLEAIADQTRSVDELSLYARRLLGETAVMTQRLIVRQQTLRVALVGQPDDDLSASTALLDEVLGAVTARIAQLGLSV